MLGRDEIPVVGQGAAVDLIWRVHAKTSTCCAGPQKTLPVDGRDVVLPSEAGGTAGYATGSHSPRTKILASVGSNISISFRLGYFTHLLLTAQNSSLTSSFHRNRPNGWPPAVPSRQPPMRHRPPPPPSRTTSSAPRPRTSRLWTPASASRPNRRGS